MGTECAAVRRHMPKRDVLGEEIGLPCGLRGEEAKRLPCAVGAWIVHFSTTCHFCGPGLSVFEQLSSHSASHVRRCSNVVFLELQNVCFIALCLLLFARDVAFE